MEKFDEFDHQLLLYAKGWYRQNNVLNDLKKIISIVSGTSVNDIKNGDVIMLLSHLVFKTGAVNSEMRFNDMISGMFERPIYTRNRGFLKYKSEPKATITRCLHSLLKAVRWWTPTIELMKPSEKYLPLTKHAKETVDSVFKS